MELRNDVNGVRYVAYMRVSTKDQDNGIQVQEDALWSYGPVAFYVDRLSGKGDSRNRVNLEAALEHCRREGCVLLFYKVDRLSRDVESLFRIVNSGIRLRCHTQPELNTMLLGILATMAQAEREEISRRTIDALRVRKERGVVLGMRSHKTRPYCPQEIGRLGGAASAERRGAAAKIRNERIGNLCCELVGVQGMSLHQAADKLNAMGFLTSMGKRFYPQTVQRMMKYGNKSNVSI